MINLRVQRILLAVFCLFYATISWHFISQNYKLGSFEARSFLSRRPVIIDWNRFKIGDPIILQNMVGPDTFINFSSNSGVEVVSDPEGMPELYLRNNKEILFPLLIQTKNSGLPQYLTRKLSELTSPRFSLVFFVWLMGMIALGLSLVFITRVNNLALPFTILACITPQFFFFLYSDYPDTTFTFNLVLGILLMFQKAEKRKTFFFAGILSGFTLYIKLAAVFFVPAILLFYWDKIKKNFLAIFLGALPFLAFILITMNRSLEGHLTKRSSTKDIHSYINSLKHFFVDIVSPEVGTLFRMMNGKKNIEFIFSTHPVYALTCLVGFACIGFLGWKYMNRKVLAKMTVFAVIYTLLITVITFGIDRDFYIYAATCAYFLTLLFVVHLNPTWSRTTGSIVFVILIMVKLVVLVNWNKYYQASKSRFNGCVSIYDCMYNDWQSKGYLGNYPLLTLNFLDVGQIEYFSRETIIPIHFASSFSKDPTEEQVIDFLQRFQHKEFRMLSSGGEHISGRSLNFYLNPEKYESLGLSFEVLQTYQYPEMRKRYQLLKVTRK